MFSAVVEVVGISLEASGRGGGDAESLFKEEEGSVAGDTESLFKEEEGSVAGASAE